MAFFNIVCLQVWLLHEPLLVGVKDEVIQKKIMDIKKDSWILYSSS